MVYQWLEIIHTKMFPTTCRLCCAPGLPGLELCRHCREDLPWLTHTCTGCAVPMPAGTSAALCPKCQKQTEQPALDRCQALFEYRNPVDSWILAMKFQQDLAVARLLGTLLLENFPLDPNGTSVLPVPLHRKRLAERGYNQALEIARPLRKLGYPLDLDCCYRKRYTTAQSALPATSRGANLRGAFSTTGPLHGRRFILIDDVFTTGVTLNELARTLKRSGAERVEAWVVARTVYRDRDT